ncbi:MFS transporter [Streptacidiphilus sp. PB12-B1b]|uniref:MFS transporter n=1 Tax=Streptacidiphilus sp. PB12-B1b TaxID=2705012 RepID=UPI0015F87248|nr:MFS transporter [Streptacidiphilus sp. PB12-B1b]QMU76293.1 MFS transporter [Streptacidiphilus sp. PB12-B1b]
MPQINKTAAAETPRSSTNARSATARSATAQPTTARPATRWPAARAAVTAFFALDGFVFAAWVVRIPAVKAQVHASAGVLGLTLLCVSAGAIVAMGPVGRLCLRHGTRAVTVGASVLLCVAVALPAQVHSAAGLGGVLLLFGAGFGAMNVALNSAAVELIAAIRRPVMPGFHAAYSLGGLIGATLGGLLATVLTAAQQLGLTAAFGLAATTALAVPLLRGGRPSPALPPEAAPGPTASATGAGSGAVRGPLLLVLLFGLVALCDAYGEGALADWGTLHLTADLHADASLAAAGFAAYSLAMTAGRLGGTRLVERFGTTPVLVGGSAVAAAGMLVAALSPWLPAVLGGFLLVGLGLANIFPLAINGAGSLDGPKGVATASMLGYGGMVLGPPVIGFLAQAMGLPDALLSVALLAALSGVAALAVRRAAPATPA